MQQLKVLASAAVLVAVFTTSGFAQSDRADSQNWTQLGCRALSFAGERNAVTFVRNHEFFDALRVYVRAGKLDLRALYVTYRDGVAENLDVHRALLAGDRTRELPLQDWDRSVDRVDVIYGAMRNAVNPQTVVCLEGFNAIVIPTTVVPTTVVPTTVIPTTVIPTTVVPTTVVPTTVDTASTPRTPGVWQLLGCTDVSSIGLPDRDSVAIGPHVGCFKAIRLYVRGADIKLVDLSVVGEDGAIRGIPIHGTLMDGARTAQVNLANVGSALQRVEIDYHATANPTRTARLCVEGVE